MASCGPVVDVGTLASDSDDAEAWEVAVGNSLVAAVGVILSRADEH